MSNSTAFTRKSINFQIVNQLRWSEIFGLTRRRTKKMFNLQTTCQLFPVVSSLRVSLMIPSTLLKKARQVNKIRASQLCKITSLGLLTWNISLRTLQTSPQAEVQLGRMFSGLTWLSVSNSSLLIWIVEHFVVWMRTAGLPNFRKLWGRID